MTKLKKAKEGMKEEVQRIQQEARERIVGYMTGAFGIIAGLAWNDFVKSLIEYFFPLEQNANVWAKFIYAATMTMIVVGVAVYLSRLLKKEEKKETTGK